MQLKKHMLGDIAVITLDGSLDSATAPSVRADLEQLRLENGTTVLDLSKMSYMSSAGLRVLLLLYRQAQGSGARVVLAHVCPDVREVMSATGFLDFFTVTDTVEEAAEVLT
jgi:anti-sigma B factor antagonist